MTVATVIDIFPDADSVAADAADRLAAAIATAISQRGRALIVLTGGGVGTALLKRLRTLPIDWKHVHLFFGDDRFVPADDDERNEKQIREALIDHIDIPAANVHSMAPSDGPYGDDIDAAAAAYADTLAALAAEGAGSPVFDVHLLGMGGEGHINSLFPHTDAVRESRRAVVAVEDSPKPPPRRISLTLPAVRHSREVWLVVAGEAKAEAVAAAVAGANPDDIPAAGAVGMDSTLWLIDAAAAARLPH